MQKTNKYEMVKSTNLWIFLFDIILLGALSYLLLPWFWRLTSFGRDRPSSLRRSSIPRPVL